MIFTHSKISNHRSKMFVKLASENEYWHLKTEKVNWKAEELILLWLWGEYESDLRNNEYYLSSGKIRPEEQKIQVYRGYSLKIVIFSSKLLHEFEGFACKNESLSRLLNTQIFFFDLTRPRKMIFVNIALFFALKII